MTAHAPARLIFIATLGAAVLLYAPPVLATGFDVGAELGIGRPIGNSGNTYRSDIVSTFLAGPRFGPRFAVLAQLHLHRVRLEKASFIKNVKGRQLVATLGPEFDLFGDGGVLEWAIHPGVGFGQTVLRTSHEGVHVDGQIQGVYAGARTGLYFFIPDTPLRLGVNATYFLFLPTRECVGKSGDWTSCDSSPAKTGQGFYSVTVGLRVTI